MRICLYPGSFDPVTNGHLSVIRRAAELFDKVFVAVMRNTGKQGGRPHEVRAELLRTACAGLDNVEVVTSEGLTCDLAGRLGARWLVRGLRGLGDLDSELTMARINKTLNHQLETVILPPEPGLEDISSSLVREIASFDGDIAAFVPEAVRDRIKNLYGPKHGEE